MTENTINNDLTMGGATGTLLAGRYRIVRQLGQGGMGSVWLAEDTKLDGFKVAIKMLPSVLVNNKRAYAQVKQEALVSLKLSHPNIVTVRAFEEEDGNPFLVMDYIDGQTLDDYLAERGKLTEEETVKLLKPVAAALDYAHTQGVVHRDVKPGNVMIRKDGTPFVLDFGIAREIQETMTRVTGKLSSGTLLYMSPEQLNGEVPKPAQDIYSFAAMAYECLKGEPPFNRGQIEFQILNKQPEPLPDDMLIGASIFAGLEKCPKDRPATCADILVARSEETCDCERVESRSSHIRVANEENTRSLVSVVHDVTHDPKPGEEMTIDLPGGATMTFCWCPATTSEDWKRISGGDDFFWMGSNELEDGRSEEETWHRVTLTRGFWIGKYEVTQRQWESVMGTKPSYFNFKSGFSNKKTLPNHPVEKVSWEDCREFIRKINVMGLVTVSLPTEAQWEYACRAGSTTPFSFGSALNGDMANCDGNYPYGTSSKGRYQHETVDVGSYAPNAWNLYDMHGNVWEWCADWYGSYDGDAIDPQGPVSGTYRVSHGGSWNHGARSCRSAYRRGYEPGVRSFDLGFRLVCSQP